MLAFSHLFILHVNVIASSMPIVPPHPQIYTLQCRFGPFLSVVDDLTQINYKEAPEIFIASSSNLHTYYHPLECIIYIYTTPWNVLYIYIPPPGM